MTTSCTSCGAKMRDGYLCRSCGRELREALKDLAPGRSLLPGHALGAAGRGVSTRWDAPSAEVVGGLAVQLDTTVARLARIGDASPRGGERPVNFHERAARTRARVSQALQPWALWLLELERPPQPPRCRHRDPVGVDCRRCAVEVPKVHAARRALWARAAAAVRGGDVAAMATYLLERVNVLEGQEEAAQLHGDVMAAVRRIERVIDRPGERIAAGECGAELDDETLCTRALYADPEEAFVDCPACGTRWKVAERRAWLLATVHDSLGTAATISAALTRLDQPVTVDRIYQWKHRGRLTQHGTDERGAPLYRLGDVVDLLVEAAQAEVRRAAKRKAS